MSDAETRAQRLARNFSELLQELRVAQAGVQILFAFLLAVAFTESYQEKSFAIRMLHLGTVLLATVSAALLIAPAVWHRVLFRRGRRESILTIANLCALWGMRFLGATMTGTVLLITEVAVGGWVALTIGALSGVMFVSLWFVVPRLILREDDTG
ncbi:MAG: DUF6328 family protein [Rhodococcus sp. (in: high G+C Gram-positive bacteria)]|uniref:DUF6328 family protein n=1 Tax=Rhodococcus sp. TaxID=1831 RepID=UPI003BB11E1C